MVRPQVWEADHQTSSSYSQAHLSLSHLDIPGVQGTLSEPALALTIPIRLGWPALSLFYHQVLFQSLFCSGFIFPPRCESQLLWDGQLLANEVSAPGCLASSLMALATPGYSDPGKQELLAWTTWVSGAGGLLTQCPALLAFLQMCVPGMVFPVESHFAISCPGPGSTPSTPFLPTKSSGPCLAARASFPDSGV